jgi:hypothetical protein
MAETMTAQDTQSQRKTGPHETQKHREGSVARMLEEQTAKLPSDVWLWAAFGSIGASLFLQMAGKKHEALFVGQWVAPFMLFGIYNKLVKIGGSDRSYQ